MQRIVHKLTESFFARYVYKQLEIVTVYLNNLLVLRL